MYLVKSYKTGSQKSSAPKPHGKQKYGAGEGTRTPTVTRQILSLAGDVWVDFPRHYAKIEGSNLKRPSDEFIICVYV